MLFFAITAAVSVSLFVLTVKSDDDSVKYLAH